MEKLEITRRLINRNKGTAASVVVNRPGKLRAAFKGNDIRKRSRFTLQLAGYAARCPVKDAVANGERSAPTLPKYVDHAEDVGNGLRYWHGKNGQVYLAMPRFGSKAESEWLLDGEVVAYSQISHMLLASEAPKERTQAEEKTDAEAKGQALFNAIKLENVESIA